MLESRPEDALVVLVRLVKSLELITVLQTKQARKLQAMLVRNYD